MTGVTFPVAMRSPIKVRSSLPHLATNMTSFWLTNGDKTTGVIKRASRPIIHRPPGAPTMMYFSLGFTTPLHVDNVRLKTQSSKRS